MGERDNGPILPFDADILSLSEEVRRVVNDNRRFLERLFDESLDDDLLDEMGEEPEGADPTAGEGE